MSFIKIFPVDKNPKFVCGRPSGIAFDTISDNLIVVEVTNGIFELDVKSGEKTQLVSNKVVIESAVRNKLEFFDEPSSKLFHRILDQPNSSTPLLSLKMAIYISPTLLLIAVSTEF